MSEWYVPEDPESKDGLLPILSDGMSGGSKAPPGTPCPMLLKL